MGGEQPAASGDPTPPSAMLLGAVLLLSFLVYAPSLTNGFTYDDLQFVSTDAPRNAPNVMVETVRPFGEYFEREMGYDGVSMQGRGFRPITVWSYALVHALSKTPDPQQPSGYRARAWLQHAVNVLLHALATWLVFLMVRLVANGTWAPLCAALAFGLQPVHTEVVASIVGRGELLPFVLGAASTLSYSAVATRRGIARLAWGAAAAVCLFLALCSKESALAWIVFVPLFAWIREGRFAQRARLLAVVVPAAAWTWLYLRFLNGLGEEFTVGYEYNPLFALPFGDRLPVAVMVLGYGLAKVFLTLGLACDYGVAVFPTDVGWSDPRVLLAAALLVSVLVGGCAMLRRQPLLFLAAASLLGFSFITSNIPVPIETIFGERLLFAPSLGVCFVVAWLADRAWSRRSRTAWAVIFALWCAWGAKWCVQRSFAWYDNRTLLLADAESQPRSLSIQRQLATYYRDRDQGLWFMQQMYCLDLDPHCVPVLNSVTAYFLGLRELTKAKEYLDRAHAAIALRPNYGARVGDVVFLNEGRWHWFSGDEQAAREAFVESRKRNPRNPRTLAHLLIFAHEDRDEKAAATLLADLERFHPRSAELLLHRGLQAWRRGDWDAAIPSLEEALVRRGLGRFPLNRAAWNALIDALGKLSRVQGQVDMLEYMLLVFPEDHDEIREELRAAQRRLRGK